MSSATPSASSEPSPALAVVVLNWNGADDTLACLESLRRSTIPVHVIVVDNGSTDSSVERIERSGLADEVVAAAANLGYAEGNNIGLRLALRRGFAVVAVLNNDTVAAPDAFEAVLESLHPGEERALSPDIRYFDRPEESWFAGGVVDRGWPRHLQREELRGEPPHLRPTELLSGCCIVARRETWERVGLFDPDYFLLFEDSDWSLRARKAGAALYVVTQSTIRHRVSASFGRNPSALLGAFYFVRNGMRFEAIYFRRELAAFALRWVIRPTPALLRSRQFGELGFRWLGAIAFLLGQRGPAPRSLQRLAARFVR